MPFDEPPVEKEKPSSETVKKKKKKEEKPPLQTEKINWKLVISYIMTTYLLTGVMAGAIYLFGREDRETYKLLRAVLAFLPVISLIFITYIVPSKIKLPGLARGKAVHFILCTVLIFSFVVLSFVFTALLGWGTFDKTLSVLELKFVINSEALNELEQELPEDKIKALEYFKDKEFSKKELIENLKNLDFRERDIEIILYYSVIGNLNIDFDTPQRQFVAYFAFAVSFCLILSVVLALGSEYAWRGFMVTQLVAVGKRKAALLSGFFWGLSLYLLF